MALSCISETDCCCLRVPLCLPFMSSFYFLSNFQTLKIFIALLSGNVRRTKLKLGAHVDNGWMYRVSRNQTAAAYSSYYFFIVRSNFSNIKNFVTLLSGTVRRTKLLLFIDYGTTRGIFPRTYSYAVVLMHIVVDVGTFIIPFPGWSTSFVETRLSPPGFFAIF